MPEATRIVVRAPNWLGDAVMALPAMGAIRRGTAGRTLILAARASIAPLFHEETPAAPDEIITIDPDREVEQLRATGADRIVLLPNSFGSAWAARRAGIGDRWGYRTAGRGLLLTRSVARPRGRRHQVEYYAALVRGLAFDMPEAESPRLGPSPFALEKASRLLDDRVVSGSSRKIGPGGKVGSGRLVGFAPGAAYGHAKRWPPARVAEVIARLGAEGLTSVLVGAMDDRETGRAIESSLAAAGAGAAVINLIGRTSLRELVGVIARCAAFVSNDSGAMHIAAALGVPLTAIFGPTDDRVTSPAGPAGAADVILRDVFCRPCMLRECPIDHRCMKRIDVNSVFSSVSGHLVKGAGA